MVKDRQYSIVMTLYQCDAHSSVYYIDDPLPIVQESHCFIGGQASLAPMKNKVNYYVKFSGYQSITDYISIKTSGSTVVCRTVVKREAAALE